MKRPIFAARLASFASFAILGLLAVAAIAAAFAGCSSDSVEASARLKSPSGLAYISRTSTINVPASERADLFVADSQAQGVRVLQLERHVDDKLQEVITTEYLPAPAIFFPLVIPAEGFPTRVAVTKDGHRLYVIAPVGRMLHVLDVHEQPLGASPTEDGAKPLAAPISFDADPALDDSIAVGVELVSGTPDGVDIVLVAFDLVASGQGMVKAFRFNVTETSAELDPSLDDSVTLGPSPRDLIQRDGVAVVTSAVTNTVTTIPLSPASPVFGAPVLVDVGGPSSNVFDGGAIGVFVTRLDRASIILLESTGGALVRSQRRFRSPYTPFEERRPTSTTALGRVDFADTPVISGAHGQILQFDTGSSDETDLLRRYKPRCASNADCPSMTTCSAEEPRVCLAVPIDVVGVVHLNGRLSFLLGPNAELAAVETSTITVVATLQGEMALAECSGETASCSDAVIAVPECQSGLIFGETAAPQTVRATYQGALANSKNATLSAVSSSSISAQIQLTDNAVYTLEASKLQAGDAALLSVEMPSSCGASDGSSFDYVFEASITGIHSNVLDLEVRTSTAVERASCAALWRVYSYEAHPTTDDLVVTVEGSGLDILRVADRVPMVHSASVATAAISGAVIGTIVAPRGVSCTTSVSDKEPCLTGFDCSNGKACVTPDACIGHCDLSACAADDTTCTALFPERICTSMEIALTRTGPYTLSLTLGSAFELGSPDDVVYSSQRRSFMVSFPGAKEIAEGYVDGGGQVQVRHIR